MAKGNNKLEKPKKMFENINKVPNKYFFVLLCCFLVKAPPPPKKKERKKNLFSLSSNPICALHNT